MTNKLNNEVHQRFSEKKCRHITFVGKDIIEKRSKRANDNNNDDKNYI